ncbi:MAG: pyridoxal phosphate-dependent aminotransferase [Candidatus Aminicenantes bacterium]|jgi:aminotransferase
MVQLKDVVPESLIRRITISCLKEKAVNLAQAFPDYDTREEFKELAIEGIKNGYSQYTHTWGLPVLRQAISKKYKGLYKIELHPEKNILVTCGCMEALRITLNTIIRGTDGDAEIIIVEPFYESFYPQTVLEGGIPVFISLNKEDFSFDVEKLKRAITKNTKALIINSPNNPCGKILTRQELSQIHEICTEKGIFIISDETYEHIVYGKNKHYSLLELDNSEGNLIVVSGTGKTYATTGWRIGYIIAHEEVTRCIRPSHDYNTVCAAAPLQYATAKMLNLPQSYYDDIVKSYEERKVFIVDALNSVGFECFEPQGAYYVFADYRKIGKQVNIQDDIEFALDYLIKKIGVGAVPASSFYYHRELAQGKIRFTFSKRMETLREAKKRLLKIGD